MASVEGFLPNLGPLVRQRPNGTDVDMLAARVLGLPNESSWGDVYHNVTPGAFPSAGANYGQLGPLEEEVMSQAYANQALNPPSGLGLSMPGEAPAPVSQNDQPSSSNFPNILYGIGLALGSAAGGSQGNFNLPMGHMQQLQQNQRVAEQRKQLFMQQQQQLEESKRQHDMQMLERIIGSSLPSSTKMEQLKQLKTPQAEALAQGMKESDLANFKAYAQYIPQEVMERFQKGELTGAEVSGHLDMAKEQHKFNLKEGIKEKLLSEAMGLPEGKRSPYQKHIVEEARAKVETEKQKAFLANAQGQKALNPAAGDRTTLGREAQALYGRSWDQLTPDEQKGAIDWHYKNLSTVQEANARGREQVKRETDMGPGVMMLENLSEMVDKAPDMFLDEKSSLPARIAQMAKVRTRYFAGDENLRQWGQMQDGMRATLARMTGEVGNLAATEQERAKQLIPDPYGSLYGVPDSKEVAQKKLKLLGEFLKAGLEAPQGPDGQSRLQNKLRGILNKLDDVAPLPSLGDLKPDEVALATEMKAKGMDKNAVHLELLKRRNGQ